MAGSDGRVQQLRHPQVGRRSPAAQVRRAWILLLSGFTVFLGLATAAGLGARWYLTNATVARLATLQPVAGQSLLVRSPNEADWRLVTESTRLREGDVIRTSTGSVGWITLFDQGTVEVSEDTEVRITRMRTTRFWGDRKEFVFEPLRGTIYVGMAPHGDYTGSEIRVEAGPATVTMTDDSRQENAGSFLVEIQREHRDGGADDPILAVRVAVLRGAAQVRSDFGSRWLSADEQTIVSSVGTFGPITPAVREMIRNGDFSRGLTDWIEYQDQGDDGGTVFGLVRRVSAVVGGRAVVAAEFSRLSESTDICASGIQQTIDQTLRVHSSLLLEADIRIDEHVAGGDRGSASFPLTFRITYIDLQGQAREWWHAFTIEPEPTGPTASDRVTRVPRGQWTHVSYDLRNVTPLPRRIGSILVYSAGQSYSAAVANLSLTSSEAGDHQGAQ